MAWKGGFTGRGYTRSEFRAFLRTQSKPAWIKFLVSHNTAAPYIKPPAIAPATRIMNLANYYKNQLKWSTGPNLVVIGDRVYVGTPLQFAGTNSPGFNGKGLGVEVEGDYRAGKHDPKSGDGLVAWKTAAWVFAELMEWLNFALDNNYLKLHREDVKTTHKCPGDLVQKPWLMSLVRSAMNNKPVLPANPPKPETKQLYDIKEIQTRLKVHGYDPGPIDGKMGPKTRAAIEAMQKALNITPSGLVGPWMMEQLRKDSKPQPVPKPPEPAPTPVPPVERPTVQAPSIVPPNVPESNPRKGMRILQEYGWPKHWAAGAIAQAQRESYPDLRPWAKGDYMLNGKPVPRTTPGASPTAFGIWQLRNDRYDNYLSFAARKGKPWDDFETQVLWMPEELREREKLAWRWLQRAETVEQANAAMCWYERPRGYNPTKARAAASWEEVFNVSENCDGYDVRLGFARALMK